MRIVNKSEQPVFYNKPKAKEKVPIDKTRFKYSPDTPITKGKYKDKTWNWLLQNDTSYVQWIKDNSLEIEFGVWVLNDIEKQKEQELNEAFKSISHKWENPFTGETWVDLVLVNEKSQRTVF